MSGHRTKLVVDELGNRTLPSGALAPIPSFLGSIVAHHGQLATAPHLHGHGLGTIQASPPTPDIGRAYSLAGSVSIKNVGTFNVAGTLHGVGFLAGGRDTGELVLSNAQGTINLALTGPTQAGFSPLPTDFAFSVTGGTGAYQHLNGAGHAHFVFSDAAASPGATPQGSFSLKF